MRRAPEQSAERGPAPPVCPAEQTAPGIGSDIIASNGVLSCVMRSRKRPDLMRMADAVAVLTRNWERRSHRRCG